MPKGSLMYVTVLASTVPSAAFAQAVAAQPVSDSAVRSSADRFDEDIVVTARRVEEKLQDVPLAVSALSGASLQRQAVRELRDLTSTVPNFSVQQGGAGASGTVVAIRGQVQANSGVLWVDPAVGVYVDGLNLPRNNGLRSALIDVSRVEVLRGPQGTLYGRNTTGGAVGIYTNDPTDKLGGQIRGSYGNYNAFDLSAILNVPLTEGLNLRLVAQHGEHSPYARQISTGEGLLDEDSTYLRAKLKYENGGFRATLSGDYFRFRSNGFVTRLSGLTPAAIDRRFSGSVANVPGAVAITAANPTGAGTFAVAGGISAAYVQRTLGLPFTPAGLTQASQILASYVLGGSQNIGFYQSYGNSAGRLGYPSDTNASNTKGGSALLDLAYDLSDVFTVRSISGWRTYNRLDTWDLDGTPFTLLNPVSTTPFENFYSEELQLLGKTEKFNWVVGLYYSYEKGLDFSPSVAFQAPGATNFAIADGLSRNISKAIFGQGSYKITDALTLTLGGRYTWDTKKIRNRNGNIGSITAAGTRTFTCAVPASLLTAGAGCEANFSAKFSDPSFLASLDYKVSPDILVYLKFSRGYRAGGQQGRANTPASPLSFQPFAPETLDEYEAGLKSELFGRLVLNLAAYWDDYSDIQRTITRQGPDPASTPFNFVTNAAKARLYGIEAEATLKVVDGLQLRGTLGTLAPKYKEFNDDLLGDRRNEDWPAPKLTYSIGAAYDGPTDFGSITASLNWDGRSRENFQPQGLFRSYTTQYAYGLLNGNLGVTFENIGVSIAAFGRNLLAKKYYITGGSVESIGFSILQQGSPRTYGVQLTKKFGDF